MTPKSITTSLAVLVLVGGTISLEGTPTFAAELPASTQEMLKNLKIDPSALKNLDDALAIPKSTMDGALKEGTVRVAGTYQPSHFRDLVRPFKTRYPGIEVHYVRASRYDRVMKTIIAYKSGKVLFDVILGFGGQGIQLEKQNALEKLSDLPALNQVPKDMRSPGDFYVGFRILTRCFAYNTDKVKIADLPKTWGDIVSSKRWDGKNLALVNRPNYWALHLWATQGEAWTKDLLGQLFRKKPQLRKESVNASMQLMAAGEFDALIGGNAHHIAVLQGKGAPAGLHCPDPIIPTLATSMGVMKGGNVNAGKIFANWFMSREGQVAQYHRARYTSIYPDLRKAGLASLPSLKLDEGKRVYYREEMWRPELSALNKVWNGLWLGAQGLQLRTVKVTIDDSKRSGRSYHFKVNGKEQKVRISSSGTVVTINGARAARKAVKKGMTCTITYPGNDQTAKEVSCTK
jgi:ABC-type Fe3+ transport system substrate-binding protein